jgi:hypothetical protein
MHQGRGESVRDTIQTIARTVVVVMMTVLLLMTSMSIIERVMEKLTQIPTLVLSILAVSSYVFV